MRDKVAADVRGGRKGGSFHWDFRLLTSAATSGVMNRSHCFPQGLGLSCLRLGFSFYETYEDKVFNSFVGFGGPLRQCFNHTIRQYGRPSLWSRSPSSWSRSPPSGYRFASSRNRPSAAGRCAAAPWSSSAASGRCAAPSRPTIRYVRDRASPTRSCASSSWNRPPSSRRGATSAYSFPSANRYCPASAWHRSAAPGRSFAAPLIRK